PVLSRSPVSMVRSWEEHCRARHLVRAALLAMPGLVAIAACSSESPATTAASSSGSTGAGGSLPDAGPSTAVAVAVSAGSGGDLPAVFTVSGIVTDGTSPVEGAIVMQGGGKPAFTTGPDGAYSIDLTQAIPGTPVVVASKIGYRTAGVEFTSLPSGPVDL